MPAAIDLDPLRDEIRHKWHTGVPKTRILAWIKEQGDQYASCSLPTLKRRFRDWDMQKETPQSYSSVLGTTGSEFLITLFYQGLASDRKILRVLHKHGFNISKHQVKRFRLAHGMKRTRDLGNRDFQDQELQEKLRAIVSNSVATNFGYRMMYTYLCQNRKDRVSRNRVQAALKVIDPRGVNRRDEQANRRQKKWRPPGPNWVWSVDGYSKLDDYGIQIYAGIDAYSRNIVWIYVGISSHTAVSVGAQYLEAIRQLGVIPVFVRSDRGGETTVMADIHWHMRMAEDPEAPAIPFPDCWMYGKSTANQRIESWWAQLYEKVVGRWIRFFDRMRADNSYIKDDMAHKIALLAIYMPIIRKEVFEWRDTWNTHQIRRQKGSHIVAGQPWDLYSNPEHFGAKDQGKVPNWDTHAHLSRQLPYDLDGYLTPATLQFCHEKIRAMGYDPDTLNASDVDEDGSAQHNRIYSTLREHLSQHMLWTNNLHPTLEIPERPRGAHGWIARAEVERIREQQVEEEEEDEVANPPHHFDGEILPHEAGVEDEGPSDAE